MAYVFVDQNGVRITPTEWEEKRANDDYRFIRRFEDDKVRVTVEWIGKVPKSSLQSFREYWPVFEMRVENGTPNGWRLDPADGEQMFGYLDDAVKAYEEFLVRWTECEQDDEGKLIEVGNKLTPPDPNIPTTAATELDPEVGAW